MKLSSSRVKDFVLIMVLLGVVAGISHFVITNPLGPSRILYRVQAPIIQWAAKCSPEAPHWMAKLQRFATRNMGAPAGQLAYVEPRGQLHHCETGWRDGVFGDERLTASDRFRFASATKTVTAVAVIDLVNKGQLALSDKIVALLGLEGELRDPRVADITIEQLLSHRGGWDRVRGQDAMFLRISSPWCPEKPEKLTETSLMHKPGEVESYSNLGYCLLGLAIEQVTGQSYRDYMADRFSFDATTLAFVDGPYLPDEVEYDTRHENFYTSSYYKHFDFKALSSSAGLSGSASDLAQLVSNALEHRPLEIRSGSSKGDCAPDTTPRCFGFGLHLYQPASGGGQLYMHEGKLPGATTALVIDPLGGVLVWVGAGAAPPGGNGREEFLGYVHQVLTEH